jgi:hypothetical protein
VTNEQPDKQLSSEAIQGQKELERRAAERVNHWSKLEKHDYDFRSWTKHKELLKAGCIYEYARESRKLRGLLALMNPKRKREAFEIKTLPTIGKSYNLPCSFEGLREEDARRTLGGALRWLEGFADELAKNMSFAKLLSTKGKEVKRSLSKRPLRFPKVGAVQLAIPFPGDYEPPWPWQPWSLNLFDPDFNPSSRCLPWRLPGRPGPKNDGSEKIAIEIQWRDFKNSQIAKEIKTFVERHRPRSEPEPPKGQKPEDTIRANLKALSVMRIWKRFPKARDLGNRICEVAKYTDYESVLKEAAEHKKRSWQGHADVAKSKAAQVQMHNARERAVRFFHALLPDEMPANY